MDAQAFFWHRLESVGIADGNQHFSLSGRLLLSHEGTHLVGRIGPISPVTELYIDDTVEELGDSCFAYQIDLSELTFAANCRVRRIGMQAFAGCLKLASIVIPQSVENLGISCFEACFDLRTVRFELNSRHETIGQGAFHTCISLETVWIPAALESIVVAAFQDLPFGQLVVIETGVELPSGGGLGLSLGFPSGK
jgi:hypothetical protein